MSVLHLSPIDKIFNAALEEAILPEVGVTSSFMSAVLGPGCQDFPIYMQKYIFMIGLSTCPR